MRVEWLDDDRRSEGTITCGLWWWKKRAQVRLQLWHGLLVWCFLPSGNPVSDTLARKINKARNWPRVARLAQIPQATLQPRPRR